MGNVLKASSPHLQLNISQFTLLTDNWKVRNFSSYYYPLPSLAMSLLCAKIDQCNIIPWYPVWSSVGPVFSVPVGPLFSVQSNSSPRGKLIHSQNPPSKLHVPGDTQNELFSVIVTNLRRTVKVRKWIASTWFSFQFLVNSHVLKLGDVVQFLSVTRSIDKGDIVDRNVTLIWLANSSGENYLES